MIRTAIVDDKAGNRYILKDKMRRNPFFTVMLEATDSEDFYQCQYSKETRYQYLQQTACKQQGAGIAYTKGLI